MKYLIFTLLLLTSCVSIECETTHQYEYEDYKICIDSLGRQIVGDSHSGPIYGYKWEVNVWEGKEKTPYSFNTTVHSATTSEYIYEMAVDYINKK